MNALRLRCRRLSRQPQSQTRRKTVVINNGVKKTIVDADDDEPTIGTPAAKDGAIKETDTAISDNKKVVVAKLERPEIDAGKLDSAVVNEGTPKLATTPSAASD